MKIIVLTLLAWIGTIQAGGDLYVCKNAKINLFSSAPIEDIKAVTTTGTSVYDAALGELDFNVNIISFQFTKSLMQEHFNSDYMESDKFPQATFKGKIQEHPDLTKDGTYSVNVSGDLTVHGVTKQRTIPGNITVKNGTITMTAEFVVKCADHSIKIPRIVFHNIAESIKINVEAVYTAYKK